MILTTVECVLECQTSQRPTEKPTAPSTRRNQAFSARKTTNRRKRRKKKIPARSPWLPSSVCRSHKCHIQRRSRPCISYIRCRMECWAPSARRETINAIARNRTHTPCGMRKVTRAELVRELEVILARKFINLEILDAELESPYPIYGRHPMTPRGYVPVVPRTKVFVGDWE